MTDAFPGLPCERTDCRLSVGSSMSTCMGWSLEYDRSGKLLSRDPNITTTSYRCSTCSKTFTHRACPAHDMDEWS